MKSSLKKAKRIGKKPSKFKFTLVVHSAEITHAPGWAKHELALQWSRNSRSAITQPSRGPDAVTPEKAKAFWEESLEMIVTLYKASHSIQEKKKFSIIFQDFKKIFFFFFSMVSVHLFVRMASLSSSSSPLSSSLVLQDDKKPEFEEKEYSLKVWEVKGDRLSKQIAIGQINLSTFASNELPLKQTLELKPTSSKIEKLILRASICAQITEAVADDQ